MTRPGAGVGTLATNRDDNLIYYCASDATGPNIGRIYAHDYVNNYDFLLVDALSDPRFNSAVNFTLSGAAYSNSMLYIAQNGTGGTGIYKLALAPYSYTAGVGVQQVRGVMYSNLTNTLSQPRLTWDPMSMRLLAVGNTGSTGRMTLFYSSVGLELYSITGAFLADRNITIGPDAVFYTVAAGSTAVNSICVYGSTLGLTYANVSSSTISSLAEFISQTA